eukprot:387809_1
MAKRRHHKKRSNHCKKTEKETTFKECRFTHCNVSCNVTQIQSMSQGHGLVTCTRCLKVKTILINNRVYAKLRLRGHTNGTQCTAAKYQHRAPGWKCSRCGKIFGPRAYIRLDQHYMDHEDWEEEDVDQDEDKEDQEDSDNENEDDDLARAQHQPNLNQENSDNEDEDDDLARAQHQQNLNQNQEQEREGYQQIEEPLNDENEDKELMELDGDNAITMG